MPTTGVLFRVTAAALPATSGRFQWVELVTHDTAKFSGAGLAIAKCTGFIQPEHDQIVFDLPPQIDAAFPYPGVYTTIDGLAVNDLMTDAPSVRLSEADGAQYAEAARNFTATTYLMWIPALTNAISVPLGSIQWGICSDAVNTLSSSATPWITLPCTSGRSAPTYTADQTYPQWMYVANFDGKSTCIAYSY